MNIKLNGEVAWLRPDNVSFDTAKIIEIISDSTIRVLWDKDGMQQLIFKEQPKLYYFNN